jgi:signal transduction histidine kinase
VPRALSWRIGLSFAVLAIATWIAIGAALFLVLRGLHAQATTAALNDVATPLVAQARQRLPAAGDVRAVLTDLRDQVQAQGYSIYVVTAEGRIVNVDGDAAQLDAIQVPVTAARGTTLDGTYHVGSQAYAWVAVVLRGPAALGPRALVLTAVDRSAADAFRDLVAALPAVVVVSLLVGGPIAWLIARSVTRPLRRLSAATAALPAGSAIPAPLPLDGPTEVRDVTRHFNAMTAELARTRREESDLLANLRHDLRTPVTVIAGFATALTDGTATGDDVGRAARAIEEEAGRLEELVSQLGAVERLDAGDAGFRPEVVLVADLLQQTAERFRGAASAVGIDVVALAPPPSLSFTADRLAVDRILANLVGNAIAAVGAGAPLPKDLDLAANRVAAGGAPRAGSPAGSEPGAGHHVWLSAREVSTTAGTGAVALEVTDDGPGFPPGATNRVFERFYRADPARTRNGGGSGLGLAIVRDLARAHGGEAFAENVAPHGARVSVVLPLVPAPASPG